MAGTSAPMLAMDVGNSRVKAGLWNDDRLVWSCAAGHSSPEAMEALIARVVAETGARRGLATVNPPASDQLIADLRDRGTDVDLILRSDGRLFAKGFLTADLETPETTGVDRALGALAALARSPGRSVIIVDCGSAITVNVATADRVFRGGAILPGFRLLARALHRGAAALPDVIWDETPIPIGRSTKSAIAAGVHHAAVGGVESLVRHAREAIALWDASEPALFLTGGDSDRLVDALGLPFVHAPHLVLEGVRLIANDWNASDGAKS